MISCDTNILFYAQHSGCSEHGRAREAMRDVARKPEFAICELVLIELYVLLRNPTLVSKPLPASEAAAVCGAYRRMPGWRLVDYPGGLMDGIWELAARNGFPRRRIFDVRLAETLLHHGVTEFWTRNVQHFEGLGFARIYNPIDEPI